MFSSPYFQFHMQDNYFAYRQTEDLEKAIFFFIIQLFHRSIWLHFKSENKRSKYQKRQRIQPVNHLFCFRIVLAKQMQKKKVKKVNQH